MTKKHFNAIANVLGIVLNKINNFQYANSGDPKTLQYMVIDDIEERLCGIFKHINPNFKAEYFKEAIKQKAIDENV